MLPLIGRFCKKIIMKKFAKFHIRKIGLLILKMCDAPVGILTVYHSAFIGLTAGDTGHDRFCRKELHENLIKMLEQRNKLTYGTDPATGQHFVSMLII